MLKELWGDCSDYSIYTQDIEGELHVHCEIERWAPSVLKALYREFVRLRIWASDKGYKEMYSISPNPRFCELFCAESLGTYKDYEVMKWDLR